MNQNLKTTVYGKGTPRQVQFISDKGGMNSEERQLFQLLHEGKEDLQIEEIMGLSRQARERIEESVRAKTAIAVFHCLDFTMDNEN